jgi:hypothetical protein
MIPAFINRKSAWSTAARVPADKKSALENTAPWGQSAMACRIISDVCMSEIIFVFQIFEYFFSLTLTQFLYRLEVGISG